MRKHVSLVSVGTICFVLGALVSVGSKTTVDATLFRGKDPQAAAEALLAEAERVAGNGSWERIAVGSIYYQSGNATKGQAFFDAVINGKPETSDYFRIGWAYARAGEWDKAKPMFEKAMELKPRGDDRMAQAAAWYILNGERERGEELLERAIGMKDSDPYFYTDAAGAYLGVEPQW